jgi:4a-hydroxytetrahydrobiopterin dehydratase
MTTDPGRSGGGGRGRPSLLSGDELTAALATVPEWSHVPADKAITRTFTWPDFVTAFGFMTSVALTAQAMDHHPDFQNSWNKVTLTLSTHVVGGLTGFDFTLAKKIDKLAGSS